mmetsp:Transcript_151854/g.485341  ORF Transcript_151854/g.485341 Transcript_151854/m.485341 type:complete len:194 (-) Transcript_151854:150-731(-)
MKSSRAAPSFRISFPAMARLGAWAAAAVAVVTAPAAAAQAACNVCLHEDQELRGTSKALGLGSYAQARDLSPVQNDQVSSLVVTGSENCRVWLYFDADYQGYSQSFTPGKYNLPYFNAMDNEATSMKVLQVVTACPCTLTRPTPGGGLGTALGSRSQPVYQCGHVGLVRGCDSVIRGRCRKYRLRHDSLRRAF